MRILVFGDSITQGFWDTEGGWVARLRRHYDELQVRNILSADQPTVFNLGISGDTTQSVLARLDNDTRSRLWLGEEIAYVFAIGLNDTVYRREEFESSPEKYYTELNNILNVAKKHSKRILFVGLTPVVDERVQPLQWSSSGKCYSNDRILEFEKVLKNFCRDNKVPYVPLFNKLHEKQQSQELMPDGAHPNNAGHKLISELIRPEVEKLLS